MKAIGKADLYYTLWDISEVEQVFVNKFEYYEKQYVTYLQNLSMDENCAIQKAVSMGCTNISIDESLRGKNSSFEINRKVEIYPIDIFPYGNLKGTCIFDSENECQLTRLAYDIKYEQSKTAQSRLIELGTHTFFDGEFMSINTMNSIIDSREKANHLALLTSDANSRGYIDILFEKNLYISDEIEYATYHIENALCIRFSNKFFTKNYYNGFVYGLLKNQKTGKGIRMKNKTYRIFIDENMFCTSFELIN